MILKHFSHYTKYENKPQWIRAVGAIPGQDFSSIPKDRCYYSGGDEHCEKWYLLQRQYDFLEFCMWRKSMGNQRYLHGFGGLRSRNANLPSINPYHGYIVTYPYFFFNNHPFCCSSKGLFSFSSHQYLTFKRTEISFSKIMHLQQNSINNFKIN